VPHACAQGISMNVWTLRAIWWSNEAREADGWIPRCCKYLRVHGSWLLGLPYTWDNRQHGADNIKVWLDRAFANPTFTDMFREIKVWHVQTTESDHCCLIIECHRHKSRRGKRKSFRYENMWRRNPSYMRLVEENWGRQMLSKIWASCSPC